MFGRKTRTSVITVILAALFVLILLAWRGMIALGEREIPPAIRWREAGGDDLF